MAQRARERERRGEDDEAAPPDFDPAAVKELDRRRGTQSWPCDLNPTADTRARLLWLAGAASGLGRVKRLEPESDSDPVNSETLRVLISNLLRFLEKNSVHENL